MGAREILAWLFSAVLSATGLSVPEAPSSVPAAPATGDVSPLISNVEFVTNVPDAGGISASFDPNRPYMYMSTLHGLTVYDVRDPLSPTPVGAVPMVMFQNENVNLGPAGSRSDGSSFVLIATDLGGAVTPTDPFASDIEPGRGGYVQHMYVVDVSDPAAPFIRSDLQLSTFTHTISCITKGCTYAYTAGTNDGFSVIDLADLDRPLEIKYIEDKWGWHDWQVDTTGAAWKSGDGGSVAFDVRDPLNPKTLNGTNKLGDSGQAWNHYIHHNSERPYARNLPIGAVRKSGTPSVFRGDVLLVTEESELGGACDDGMGRFQTWEIPSLRSGDVAGNVRARGTMKPLDSWRASFADGVDLPRGFGCSAHYFDFNRSGFVAQGWYEYGVRILDVRDARKIKQVGYFMVPGQETWAAYWVPKRDRFGRTFLGADGTPADSSIVYSVDAVRGLDVLRVKLPTTSAARTKSVPQPMVPDWLRADVAVEAASLTFSCRVRSN